MPDKKLMKLMVECPGVVRDIYLTREQVALWEFVNSSEIPTRSRHVAAYFDISMNSASTRLNTLWKKKYLTRLEVGNHAGGREYEYKAVKFR